MKKTILATTIVTVVSMALLLMPIFTAQALAADKIGWVGPIYKELSASLNKGFKAYYKKTYGKNVDITFVRPGGWPVCVDKVRAWGGKPDADIFLGAGAPAHEVLKKEGLLIPYRPKNWDKVPAEWHGMKVKDKDNYWICFAPWIVTNLYNEKVLKKLRLPPPKTWQDLGDKKWRGKVVLANPALSGSAYAQLFQMVHLYGWDFINEVRKVSTFVPKSTLVYTFVGRGEFAIGVTGEGNVFGEINKGHPVATVYPSEGTGLRFDASGIIKGGPNPDNAKIFMDWLTTKDAMAIISRAPHFRRMARPDVPPPPGLKPSSKIKFFPYEAMKASKSRNDYLQKFGEIFATRK